MQNEIITEINEIIIDFPEDKLQTVLEYLRLVKNLNADQFETLNLSNQVMIEDEGLLKRLAQ